MTHANQYKVDLTDATRANTYYSLAMFPYPSGAGLHVGHGSNFTANDIIARYKRMQGFHVINPMGWDSFGLPTENYAMKMGKPASQVTEENIAFYKQQCEMMDRSFDRDREITTSSPEYYKWTQRIFHKLFSAGLVYKTESFVNRCSTCQTVLANDQVINGKCERCDTEVIQKKHPQRCIKITDYADKLLAGLDTIDRPEETKTAQRYWIGRSEGAEIDFAVGEGKITVFTTRPDTLFGVTALVLAPENNTIDTLIPQEYMEGVADYRLLTSKKTAIERQQDADQKSGVFSGIYARHPLTQEKIPVRFADYVLPDYATGAVMFVPAHDERDWSFAKKHNLPVIDVIMPEAGETEYECFTGTGVLINSAQFDGLSNTEAKSAITAHLESLGYAGAKTTYKLRDWSVSRQRYWGSPIPVYYTFRDPQYSAHNPDPDHTRRIPHLIPEEQLPVVLPLDVANYKPAGKSPLADHPTFPYYTAPDGQVYLRECDTLDTFMCSSFYYLRFIDPTNTEQLISPTLAATALPVDFYIGGKEHTYGHLLYSRFINRFLYDQGVIPNPEPFAKLFHQGMVLGPDGRKMSKRRGNVITPQEVAERYSADAFRVYVMFMGPLEGEKARSDTALQGVKRFLDRVERMQEFVGEHTNDTIDIALHKAIQGVTDDIEKLKLNTAVSKMMIFVNEVYEHKTITRVQLLTFSQLLAPYATKLSQQMWEKHGGEGSVHYATRPTFDPAKTIDTQINLPVQINGKMKGTIAISPTASQEEVLSQLHKDDKFASSLTGEIKKIIFVPGKIINLIVG